MKPDGSRMSLPKAGSLEQTSEFTCRPRPLCLFTTCRKQPGRRVIREVAIYDLESDDDDDDGTSAAVAAAAAAAAAASMANSLATAAPVFDDETGCNLEALLASSLHSPSPKFWSTSEVPKPASPCGCSMPAWSRRSWCRGKDFGHVGGYMVSIRMSRFSIRWGGLSSLVR